MKAEYHLTPAEHLRALADRLEAGELSCTEFVAVLVTRQDDRNFELRVVAPDTSYVESVSYLEMAKSIQLKQIFGT